MASDANDQSDSSTAIKGVTSQSWPGSSADLAPASIFTCGPFLVRQPTRGGWIALSFEAKALAGNHEINVLRKPVDEPERLGQGRPTFEEQPRMPFGTPVEQRVEHQADPEVLLDVARQRIEVGRRRFEDIPPVLLRQGEERFEA